MKKGTRESKLLTLLLSLSILFSTQIAAVYAQGDEPAEAVYQLTGTVCQYGYDQAETSGAAKSGIEVTIELANGSTTVTSDSNGNIAYTFEDEAARTDTGKYSWSIAKDGDHFEASGTLEEGTEEDPVENKLYVRERYIPSGSDFEFEASENVKVINGEVWLKSAGSYAIKGKSGKKISKILDGSSSSEVSVNVSSAGVVENIFIFIGNLCSKVLSGFHVNVDSGAPVIESVTTKPANDNTTVKEHGVYGRTKAEIILEADISR